METLYIVWNEIDDRPLISRDNFGNLLIYLTKEQAQARLISQSYTIADTDEQKPQFSIKEVKVSFT